MTGARCQAESMLLRPTSHVRTGIGMQTTLSCQAGHAASHGFLFVHRLHNFLLVAFARAIILPWFWRVLFSPMDLGDFSVVSFQNVVQCWC